MDGVVQGDHVGLAVDPQHRGGDVLSQVALQHKHHEGEILDKLKTNHRLPAEETNGEQKQVNKTKVWSRCSWVQSVDHESRRWDYRGIRSGFGSGA